MESAGGLALTSMLLFGLIATIPVVFLVVVLRRSDGSSPTSRRSRLLAGITLAVLLLAVLGVVLTLATSSLTRNEHRTFIDVDCPGAEIFLGSERVATSSFDSELTGTESYCLRVPLSSGIEAAVRQSLPTGSKVIEQRPRSSAASSGGLRGRILEVVAERPGGVEDSFVLLAFEDPAADEIRAVALRCYEPGHGAIKTLVSTPTARGRGSGFLFYRKRTSEVSLHVILTLDADPGEERRWVPPRGEAQQ